MIDGAHVPGQLPLHSDGPAWLRQMSAAPLPAGTDFVSRKCRLYDEYRTEIPFVLWNGGPLIRISLQGYNSGADIDLLLKALHSLINTA